MSVHAPKPRLDVAGVATALIDVAPPTATPPPPLPTAPRKPHQQVAFYLRES